MKTTLAILAQIRLHKTCSTAQLYRYFAAFHIEPVGVRQRPRLYPDDAAERILKALGLIDLPNGTPVYEEPAAKPVRQVSMRELRNERSKARRAA